MKFRKVYISAFLLLFFANPAKAILIGDLNNTNGANCNPFGCDADQTRYQQVYDSKEFSGAIDIYTINFFLQNSFNQTLNLNTGTFEIHLSTTSVEVPLLDKNNLNNNVGADDQLFVNVNLNGELAPDILSFSGTPFSYDPSQGNLLLDIFISGISHEGLNAYYWHSVSSDPTEKAYEASFESPSYREGGLITEFTTSPVPVPAAVWLMGSALLGLVGFRKKKT